MRRSSFEEAARDAVGHVRDPPLGGESLGLGGGEAADEVGLKESQFDSRGQRARDSEVGEGVDRELEALLGAMLSAVSWLP